MTQPTASTALRPPKQGTWNWLLSSCFGKDHGSHADDASSTRKRSGTGTSNYGGIGFNTPYSATAASSLNTSLAGSSGLPYGKGNLNKNNNNKGDLWVNAMNALLAEIEARQETKVPSFNWRMRSNFGTGVTCVGPDGAKRLSHLLAAKCKERRERIAALTVRLGGNGGCNTNNKYLNSYDDDGTIIGGNKVLIDATADTSGDVTVATSSSCAAIQAPTSDEERAKLTTELAILESSAAHAVRHLDLRGQQVSDEGAAALGELLAEDDCIEILTLVKNNVSPKGIVALAGGLSQNRGTLKRLILGEGNEIDSKATVHLCRAIRSQQMRKEYSSSNGRNSFASASAAVSSSGGGGSHSYNAQSSPQQSVLRTGGTTTNGSSVLSANATMIVVPPTVSPQQSEFSGTSNGLVDLEIGFGPNFTLNDDAMMALRDACFSSSSTLRTVKVSPSPKAFTAASLGAILRGLAQNRKLNTLILTNCVEESTLFGPNGARPLLEPFATGALCRVDSPLRTLEISNIAIGDSGAKVLADALRLRTAAQLRTLTLTKCSIGVFGFEMLGAMMEQNPHLARVDVSGNFNNNSTYGGNTENQDASSAVESASMPNAVKKGDQARALILALCGLGSGAIGTSSKSVSPAPNGMSPAGSLRRSASASYPTSLSAPPCGLQELFISDYHVTLDAVSALIDALTKGGAAGQPSSSSAALRLRTFRYGSCDAPDSAQTRLHNLISENNEEYLALVAAKEKQQQQQQTQASPEGRGQQVGGGGAGLGSSTRRAIVTFTSGGLPTTAVASASNPHAREGSYSANSYAYHDGETALSSSSRAHYRSTSAASSVPHSPSAAATLNFAASSAFFNSNNSIVSAAGSGKSSNNAVVGGSRKEDEGEEQRAGVGGDAVGSAFSRRSDSATPTDGRSTKQQQNYNPQTTTDGHPQHNTESSSVAKDLTEVMSPNPRAPSAVSGQYQQQENEAEAESREDFGGQVNRRENNNDAAAADIDEIELDF